ncbi:uncharacterized protein BDW70DRAFT_164802 [Aspergillus foveolatus]|uniref:uncharacterized protein n=1 Tax=Aspergillus foveolatus TaxID=210207 RepID=UPI003CCDAF36
MTGALPAPSPELSSPAAASSDTREEDGEPEDDEEESSGGEASSLPAVPSSETEAAANALYAAKEKYKCLVHRKKMRRAREDYPDLMPSGIATFELEDELGDAMRVADFPIQTNIHIRVNGRSLYRKILASDYTRRTFDIYEMEDALYRFLEKHVGKYDFKATERTVLFKQESGRGGTKHLGMEEFSIPAAEEVLKHMEEFRNIFTKAARKIWTWEIHVQYEKKHPVSTNTSAAAEVTQEAPQTAAQPTDSDAIPSSPPLPAEPSNARAAFIAR